MYYGAFKCLNCFKKPGFIENKAYILLWSKEVSCPTENFCHYKKPEITILRDMFIALSMPVNFLRQCTM